MKSWSETLKTLNMEDDNKMRVLFRDKEGLSIMEAVYAAVSTNIEDWVPQDEMGIVKQPEYSVIMTQSDGTEDYIVVVNITKEEADEIIHTMYRDGKVDISSYDVIVFPSFED